MQRWSAPADGEASKPGFLQASQSVQSRATEIGVRTIPAGGAGSARSTNHPRKRQPQATEKASRAPPAGRPRKCSTSAAAAEAQCCEPRHAVALLSRARSSSREARGAPFGGRNSRRTRGTTSASAPSRTAEPGADRPQAPHRQAGVAAAAISAPSGTQGPLPHASQGRPRHPSGAQQRVQAQRKPRSVSKMARRTSVPIHQRPVSWKYQLPNASPSAMSLQAVATRVFCSVSTLTKTFGEQECATLQATGARAQS
mmetsp:Transcript_27829/g.83125  ORF Transcript_27829/g.83125 Transcript_27829/m.83125 type:complete len:256 (-) Transcript_27829:400-1167(-)